MAEWIELGEGYVLGAMPSDVGAAYASWIAAKPEKAGRLAVIVGQVLADFRTGLSANPNVVMDADETKLEVRCVPHALATVVYHLMMEMGLSINMSGMTAFNNAQVYLRRLYTSDEVLAGAVSASPSYRGRVSGEWGVVSGEWGNRETGDGRRELQMTRISRMGRNRGRGRGISEQLAVGSWQSGRPETGDRRRETASRGGAGARRGEATDLADGADGADDAGMKDGISRTRTRGGGMKLGVVMLAAGMVIGGGRPAWAAGFTHTYPLGASGSLALTNSQANSGWIVAAVMWQYRAASTGTVTVSRVSQGVGVLLGWRTHSNRTSIVWIPEGVYSFGCGEALVVGSTETNGVVQVVRRGE